jgi:hypothetical protein
MISTSRFRGNILECDPPPLHVCFGELAAAQPYLSRWNFFQNRLLSGVSVGLHLDLVLTMGPESCTSSSRQVGGTSFDQLANEKASLTLVENEAFCELLFG